MAELLPPTRFFIALVPPHEVHHAAMQVIEDLSARFNTRTAKAPPHITLQPPFAWPKPHRQVLQNHVTAFVSGQLSLETARPMPVPITLSGFGAFAPRVLFINVVKTPELLALQAELMRTLEDALGIVDPQAKARGFSPHITVASRNLTRVTFQQAWAELRSQSLSFEWIGDRLIVFRHDGQCWQTDSTYTLHSN